MAEPTPDPNHLLAAALRYAAELNWPVFPLHALRDGRCTCGDAACVRSAGKHPRTKYGVNDATTDPATIRGWWRRWPDANVGVATGSRSS